jgi:hypothetical protein
VPCIQTDYYESYLSYVTDGSDTLYVHAVTNDSVLISNTLEQDKTDYKEFYITFAGGRESLVESAIAIELKTIGPFGADAVLNKAGERIYSWPPEEEEPEHPTTGNYFYDYNDHTDLVASYGNWSICQIIKTARFMKEILYDSGEEIVQHIDWVIAGATDYLENPLDYDTESPTEDTVLTAKLQELAAVVGITDGSNIQDLDMDVQILK